MIIMGIDPGFHITGFAILKKEQSVTYILDYGYLRMSPTKSLAERIGIFHDFFEQDECF